MAADVTVGFHAVVTVASALRDENEPNEKIQKTHPR